MKIGIIGANGYSGVELIRILSQHPKVEIAYLASHSTSGKMITEQYPHLLGIVEQKIEDINLELAKEKADFFFFATPAGVAKELIPSFLESNIPCIDLSGDHRLKNTELYEEWYKYTPASKSVIAKAVYGLTELFRDDIENATLIANPGCYPTATLLGLAPVIKKQAVHRHSIIVDGKSGVTGAGRKAALGTHYCEINENLKAYKLGAHQHIPEMEEVLESLSGEQMNITFSTHLIPMSRGLMCTIYADLKETISTNDVLKWYQDFYKEHHFVRIREENHWPATKEVYASNYCDIGIKVDKRTNRLMIVSVIDNVMKGAAGQAVQNMNMMKGWEEQTGLHMTPVYP